MFVDAVEEHFDVGMIVGCGEFVMNQLISVGNGGGNSCWVWFIPVALCVVALAWSSVLQRNGFNHLVLVLECGCGFEEVWSALNVDVTVDKVVVRRL